MSDTGSMDPAAPARPTPWLHSPASDLLLGSGLVYAPIFVSLAFFGETIQAVLPITLMPLLMLLVNAPHLGATLLRVYEHAEDRQRYRFFAVHLSLVIAATVAALGVQYLRPAGETGKQRTCDMTREILQTDALRFTESTGRAPSSDLRELRTPQYSGTVLPTCPVTGQSYLLDRSGIVTCPTHETTRVR